MRIVQRSPGYSVEDAAATVLVGPSRTPATAPRIAQGNAVETVFAMTLPLGVMSIVIAVPRIAVSAQAIAASKISPPVARIQV